MMASENDLNMSSVPCTVSDEMRLLRAVLQCARNDSGIRLHTGQLRPGSCTLYMST